MRVEPEYLRGWGVASNIRRSARAPVPTLILSGSICALATPLRERDDALDLDACARLIEHQLVGGTRALAVAGSTGEAAALDDCEYSALLEFCVARIGRRVPVLAGSGLSSTRATIARTRRAQAAGVDFALVVAPAYVRATQEGMYRHFCEVAEHGGLPVVLYNVPARTACDLLPETVARLTRHGNIVGIKEAVAEAARMQALLALKGADFRVFSGDDPTAARALAAGADGVISVAANVAPHPFAALCEAALAGEVARAPTSMSGCNRCMHCSAWSRIRFRSNGACPGSASVKPICACRCWHCPTGTMPPRARCCRASLFCPRRRARRPETHAPALPAPRMPEALLCGATGGRRRCGGLLDYADN